MKCKDCKWLSEKKCSIGRLCVNPEKKFRTRTAMWKPPTARACKCFNGQYGEMIYEYKGRIYCNIALDNNNYGGDLTALYNRLQRDGKVMEWTTFKSTRDCDKKVEYLSPEQLIVKEFSDLVVGTTEGEA